MGIREEKSLCKQTPLGNVKYYPSLTLYVCRYWKVTMATKLPSDKADLRLGRAVYSPSVPLEALVLLVKRKTWAEKTPKIHPSPLPSPVHGLHNVLYILFYFESSLQIHHPGLKDMRMEMPYSASASVVIQMHPHPHALRHLFHLWESPDTCSLHLLSAKACQRSWIGCSHLGPSCTSCLLSLKDK